MTNDLDNLLEQVEDVLEEDGSALWQPDLTSLVLPQAPEDRAKANPQDSQAGAYADPSDALAGFSALEEQQALPRFQRAGEDNSQTPGSNGSDPQDLSQGIAAQSSSPALLEQLRTIDKQRLREKICHIDGELLEQVNQALKVSLAMDT